MEKHSKKRRLDLAYSLTLGITVLLFVVAVFEKGLTHELLLEAGVFLVSVKLVISTQKTSFETREIREKLDQILMRLGEKNRDA